MKLNPFEPSKPVVQAPVLEGQNQLLYEHLSMGKAFTFLQARWLGIHNLAVRVAILRDAGVNVYERAIRINNIACQEYSLHPFD